eukprot:TRINITY_DN617_c0_g1_i5.p1 TRINITY_DN617_c0_g1~~TRINITY_DN617_c0_g1_i5.p1  ORF type:complete len:341 (-),score=78.94 TRINITY_DN617_c0_g1_i5:77-1099(-)
MTTPKETQAILIKQYPEGLPKESDFELKSIPVAEVTEGSVLLKILWLSVDPYLRGRLKPNNNPMPLGEPGASAGVGQVVESKNSKLNVGDYLYGNFPWQEFVVLSQEKVNEAMKLDLSGGLEPNLALSVFGITGLTAYFGLLRVGQLKEGENVLVSGAAGATGSSVGQIAKIKGARVVGVCGGKEKAQFLKEIGFDEVIDYKEEKNLQEALKKAFPNGIDVYFDNVGGEISDIAVGLLNRFGRVVVCGQISIYNEDGPASTKLQGPRLWHLLIYKSIRIEGFVVLTYRPEFPEAIKELITWYSQGKLKKKETIENGLANLPKAFIGLFKGENIGKQLVKL